MTTYVTIADLASAAALGGSNLLEIYQGASPSKQVSLSDLATFINSNITSVGTITAGVWHGTAIESAYLDLSGLTPADIGLGNVTNDAQTKAAIVPNTLPAAGQILVGNAGGTAYAPVTISGDATMDSDGVITIIGGAGNVVGPAGATDTAIALWNTNTGELLKNSLVLVDTSGNLVTPGKLAAGGSDSMTINGAVITSIIAANSDTMSVIESHSHSATAGNGATFYSARSRGTTASPTVVQNGDTLAIFGAVGYDGIDYAIGGTMTFSVSGTPGSNDMPTKFVLALSPDGSQTPGAVITANPDKSVELTGTLVPTATLSTTMTAGFQNMAGAAGTPTGVPSNTTGYPTFWDSTNKLLYVYSGSAWNPTSAGRYGQTFEFSLSLSDLTTALTTGTNKAYWRPAFAAANVSCRSSVLTVSSSGLVTVDVNKNGTSMMTTDKLSIDANEKTSLTAATPVGMTTTTWANDDELTFDIDAAGTGAAGLIVTMTGTYA